ncbi:hypothetical protein IEO21_05421 [Rhodonia placenta]|uniref:Uncharacterized protein n=1 Tax=Rhodonia placenta TaxID=104341 RepID=A0A8H7U240_9APHY|nr:hypothetical protein IEO21_05421 [Postia placenta]
MSLKRQRSAPATASRTWATKSSVHQITARLTRTPIASLEDTRRPCTMTAPPQRRKNMLVRCSRLRGTRSRETRVSLMMSMKSA